MAAGRDGEQASDTAARKRCGSSRHGGRLCSGAVCERAGDECLARRQVRYERGGASERDLFAEACDDACDGLAHGRYFCGACGVGSDLVRHDRAVEERVDWQVAQGLGVYLGDEREPCGSVSDVARKLSKQLVARDKVCFAVELDDGRARARGEAVAERAHGDGALGGDALCDLGLALRAVLGAVLIQPSNGCRDVVRVRCVRLARRGERLARLDERGAGHGAAHLGDRLD